MNEFDFDFFIIGGGSGGVRAARVAAGHGARVGIAESRRYGGTCVIRGCVPKKLLVQAAHYAEDFADAKGFGWTVPLPSFSWNAMVAAKEKEISRLSQIYEEMLEKSGATAFHGSARFVDSHTVQIEDRHIRARHFLIATGGKPYRPQVPGVEHVVTSDEAFDLPSFPKRLLIVGSISPSNLPEYSTVWALTSPWLTGESKSCAASTTMCANTSTTRWSRRASTSV